MRHLRITIQLGSDVLHDSELFARWVRATLAGLVMVNRAELRRCPHFPRLFSSGVRFRREPRGVETFVDARTCLAQGHGDCAHLGAWRVAELVERDGEPAKLKIIWPLKRRPKLFHVVVRRGDGSVEDTSRLLGM